MNTARVMEMFAPRLGVEGKKKGAPSRLTFIFHLMLTVAQLVELQIVVLVVVSSILICQPNGPIVQSGLGL